MCVLLLILRPPRAVSSSNSRPRLRTARGPHAFVLPGVKVGRLGLLGQLVLAVGKRGGSPASLRRLRGGGPERSLPRLLFFFFVLEGGGIRRGRGRGEHRQGTESGTEESPANGGFGWVQWSAPWSSSAWAAMDLGGSMGRDGAGRVGRGAPAGATSFFSTGAADATTREARRGAVTRAGALRLTSDATTDILIGRTVLTRGRAGACRGFGATRREHVEV